MRLCGMLGSYGAPSSLVWVEEEAALCSVCGGPFFANLKLCLYSMFLFFFSFNPGLRYCT